MTRRSLRRLEWALTEAANAAESARAHYELGLFHDNNAREAAAIPHYEAALASGLAGHLRTECLAWLASSLLKTGRPAEALVRALAAESLQPDVALTRFLAGLKKRIARRLA